MSSFGTYVNVDGDTVFRDLPIQFLDALPASGLFVGDMVSLTTGAVGLYTWNGSAWVGPLGTGGGGGGAPTAAEYLVGALDGALSNERLVTDTPTVTWDLATPGQAKAGVPDAGITYPKIQAVTAAERLLGRGAAGAGQVQEISVGAGLTFSGTTLKANASGASFPLSPDDGDLFYRNDQGTLYFYRAASARWLSVQVHEFIFGATNSIATNTYFYSGMGVGFARYSNTLGHLYGFNTQLVGIACRFSIPTTCVVQVTQSGSNITGGTLTFTAQVNKTREDFFPAAVIPVDAPIAVKNTGGATGTSSCIGKIRLRRSEV